jgi:hypothetical protein
MKNGDAARWTEDLAKHMLVLSFLPSFHLSISFPSPKTAKAAASVQNQHDTFTTCNTACAEGPREESVFQIRIQHVDFRLRKLKYRTMFYS